MTGTQRRQFEMLTRVREFGNTYKEALASSPVAPELFGAVGMALDTLTASDSRKLSARSAVRGDEKQQARAALNQLLHKASALARVLRAEGHAIPRFDLPESRTDQAILIAARRVADDARSCAAMFDDHGLTASHIAEVTTAFEAAAAAVSAGRAAHLAADVEIQELLGSARRHARRLDVVVKTALAKDAVARALWKQARRVDARKSNGDEATAGASVGTTDSADTAAGAVKPPAEEAA